MCVSLCFPSQVCVWLHVCVCVCVCIPHVCAAAFLHLTSQTLTDYLSCAQFWL